MALKDCKIIKLPKLSELKGSLSFIESEKHIPFKIRRIYYLYENHSKMIRGEHAHKNLEQLIVPISGSFDITINDGHDIEKFHLNAKNSGLYLCPMIWRELSNFSDNAVCLVLASELYEKDDYIHDFNNFILQAQKK
jgi:dTDP-4-dehydrorhamnose 3,5-epimerase-like enzyme